MSSRPIWQPRDTHLPKKSLRRSRRPRTFLPNRKSWSLQSRCLRALISDTLHSRRDASRCVNEWSSPRSASASRPCSVLQSPGNPISSQRQNRQRIRTSRRQSRLPLLPLRHPPQRRLRPNRRPLHRLRHHRRRQSWPSSLKQWLKIWPPCDAVLSNSAPSRNSLPPPNNNWISSHPNRHNSSPSRNSSRRISRNCRRPSRA